MDSVTMEIDKGKREDLENAHEAAVAESHATKTLHTEADLSEHEEVFDESLEDEDHDHEHDHKHVDYSNYSKAQLVGVVKDLARENNFKKVDSTLKELKPVYDEIREKER